MIDKAIEATVLNEFEEPATHDDCIDRHEGACAGAMVYYWTKAGNTVLRCERHAEKAYKRQDAIARSYR